MDYHTDIPEMDKELDERFAILSPQVQSLITGNKIETISEWLSRRYNLTEGEQNSIMREIMLILMYIEPVDDLFNNLVTEDLIDPEVATAVVDTVRREIFEPVINELGTRKTLEVDEQHALEKQQQQLAGPRVPDLSEIRPDNFKPAAPDVPTSYIPPQVVPPTPPAPSTGIPPINVMPHTPEEVARKAVPNPSTELPNALLKNLRASLAHSEVEQPPEEEPARRPSYGTMLNTKPPTQP